MKRWTVYQLLATLFLIIVLFVIEHSSYQIAVSFDPDLQDENISRHHMLLAIFIIGIIAWVYFLMYFQLKKHPHFLDHSLWRKMPVILGIVGFLSIVVFLALAVAGPLMQWIEQYRWVLHVWIVYFIFLFFLFAVSIVHKKNRATYSLNASFIWTGVILLIVVFALPL